MFRGDINQKIRVGLGLLFIGAGVWVMVSDVLPPAVYGKYRYIMGFTLMCYGVYRMVHFQYRENLKRRAEKENESGDDE